MIKLSNLPDQIMKVAKSYEKENETFDVFPC